MSANFWKMLAPRADHEYAGQTANALIPIAGHEGRVLRLRLGFRCWNLTRSAPCLTYQGSGVKEAWRGEVPGGTPGSLIWIVDFHVRDNDLAYTAGDQNSTVGQNVAGGPRSLWGARR